MIEPKEKARELVDKYKPLCGGFWGGKINKVFAKQCAVIAVKEIREAIDWHQHEYPTQEDNYWQQVEQEIQNL